MFHIVCGSDKRVDLPLRRETPQKNLKTCFLNALKLTVFTIKQNSNYMNKYSLMVAFTQTYLQFSTS